MIDPITRHSVHVLRQAGISLRKIARQLKISKAAICRILHEPDASPDPIVVQAPPAQPSSESRTVGRPSGVVAFHKIVAEILQAEPNLPGVEIVHRTRQRGYTGGKSALYELIGRLRPMRTTPLVRFEGLAGEFSQHDFGMVRVQYENGRSEVVPFFASRLKWSRWSAVDLTPDQGVESLVRALLRAFDQFGGVPLVAVFDNPKTVVLKRQGECVEWNPTFGQVALDLRFAPELCAPRRANQKGAVENLVGWVKNSFFKVRRFADREDLREQLRQWLHEVNTQRASRATGVIPAARLAEERQRLRPMPLSAQEYALRFAILVGPTGWVEFRGIRYSMPPDAIHLPGTLWLYPDTVRIVAGQYQAQHPRFPTPGAISSLPQHAAAGLAAVSGRRAKLYYQRQRLLELGAQAETFLTEIVHARQRTWKTDVEQLFDGLQQVGPQRLLEAIGQALADRCYGAEYVIEWLQTHRPLPLWEPQEAPREN
jgi:transposase